MNGGAVAAWEKSPGKSQEEIAALQEQQRRRRGYVPDDQSIIPHQFRASEQPQDREQNARGAMEGKRS